MQFSWPVNAKRSIQGASLRNSSLTKEGIAAGFTHALRKSAGGSILPDFAMTFISGITSLQASLCCSTTLLG
jgi:hypothetical protein